MAAITTQRIKKLIAQLRQDYSNIDFNEGDDCFWSNGSGIITFINDDKYVPYLLHELAHALLEHKTYSLDIELIAQERSAWDKALYELGPKYKAAIDPQVAQDALDSYREWLYARSLCPKCQQTGVQNQTSTYVCINCRCSWHPNDARKCALRRAIVG